MITRLTSVSFVFQRDDGLHIVAFLDRGAGYRGETFIKNLWQVRVTGPGYKSINETSLQPNRTTAMHWLKSVMLEKKILSYKQKTNE